MDIFVVYAINRTLYRISGFLWHWYIDGFKLVSHKTVSLLALLDESFALKITLRHIFDPLYQDKSIISYILGFIFRTLRIFIGGLIYGLIYLISFCVYFVWAFIPFFIVFQIIKGLWPAGAGIVVESVSLFKMPI